MFKWNEKTHTYEIMSNSAVAVAKKNIDEIAKLDLVILNDEDLKAVKKRRTELNKNVEEVANARKQMSAIVLGAFAPQCEEIEKYGKKMSAELTKKINEYLGEEKVPSYQITITSSDKATIERIKKYAARLECQVKEKEG